MHCMKLYYYIMQYGRWSVYHTYYVVNLKYRPYIYKLLDTMIDQNISKTKV